MRHATSALLMIFLCQGTALASDLNLTVIDSRGLGPTWDSGIAAFDEEIDFGSCIEDSGAGCPNISWSWVENDCLLYTSPSPRDRQKSRMPSSA